MKLILNLLFPAFLVFSGYGAALGEVRDFDIPIFLSQALESVTATVQATRSYRPGFTLNFWVEKSAWEAGELNGLNQDSSLNRSEDRKATLEEFASFLSQRLLPDMEGSSFNLSPVLNSAHPGLNIIFLDLKDQYESTGSYVAAHFNSNDQDPGAGFNGMNLIYVDISPGTLGLPIDESITRGRTYTELVRAISELIQFQQDETEDRWVREGISQYMTYRFLAQTPFPNSGSRILDAPANTLPEVELYLQDLRAMYAGFNPNAPDQDRVFVGSNPRDPSDNAQSQVFRGFSYLFFTYIFHQAGGGFSKKVTDGDRFFKSLMTTSLDGLRGIEQALSEHSLPVFADLYRDFFLAIFLDSTEDRFKLISFNFQSPSLVSYPVLETTGSLSVLRLNPQQLGIERFRNSGDSTETEVHLTFPAGFGQAQALILKQDSLSQWRQQGRFSENSPFEFLPPGSEKLALIINLDSQDRDYRAQIVNSRFTQELSEDLLVSTSGNNPVTQVDDQQILLIDDSQLPSPGTSLNILLTLATPGTKRVFVENRSSLPIAFSLEDSSITTRVNLELKGETRLSISSLSPVTNARLILLREGARGELWIFNENTQAVNLSLFVESVDSSLFASGAPAFASQTSLALSAEEIQKIAGGGVGGCFVATAAYGKLSHPLVRVLTRFRDRFLLSFGLGHTIVQLYYRYSPPLASIIGDSLVLRGLTGLLLLPLVLMAWFCLNPWFAWFFLIGLFFRLIPKGSES